MKMKNLPTIKRTLLAGFITLATLPLSQTASYAQAIPCLNTNANASHYNYSVTKNFFYDIGQEGTVSAGSVSFDNYFEYTVSLNILYQTGSNLGSPQVKSYSIQLPYRSKIVGITNFDGYQLVTMVAHNGYTAVPLYLVLKCTDFNQPPYIEKCFTLDPANTPNGLFPQHTVTDGSNIFTTGYFIDNASNNINPDAPEEKSLFVLKFDYYGGSLICKTHNTSKVSTGGYNPADIPDYDNGMRLQLLNDAVLVTATANGKSSADVGGYVDAINSSYARNLILKKSTLDIAEDHAFGYTYSGTLSPTSFNGLVNVDLAKYKDYAYINVLTAYRDGELAMPALAAVDNNLKLMTSTNNALEIKTIPYSYNTKTQPMNIHNIGDLSTTFSITGIRSMINDISYVPFTFGLGLDISNGELYPSGGFGFSYTPNASGCEPFFNFNANRLNASIPLWTNPYSSMLPSPDGDLLQMDLLKFQGNNKDARFIYQKYTGTHYCDNALSVDANSESYVQQYIPVQEQDINLSPNFHPATAGLYPVQITSCNVNPSIYSKMLQLDAAFSIKDVYPNPSSTGDFTLNLSDNSDQFHIRITNVIGQVVMDKDLTGFTHQLHIPSTGLYLIEVTNAAGAKQHTRISIK
ncbi:hypothetical protein D3C72_407140 [compost metagenome]